MPPSDSPPRGSDTLAAAVLVGAGSDSTHAAMPPSDSAPRGSDTLEFDISAQPLSTAVEAFAGATGIQVLYDRPARGDLLSPGVHGRLTPRAALTALLAGTGLTAHFNDFQDAVLAPARSDDGAAPAGPRSPRSGPVLSLAPLEVNAPAMIEAGHRGGFDQSFYTTIIQNAIRQALTKNTLTAKGDYSGTLLLWIGRSGVVERLALQASTGSPPRDAAIMEVLQGYPLDAPAPADMPQPITIRVRVRPSGH